MAAAKVRADGSLSADGETGSIHKIAAHVQGLTACNSWTYWHMQKNKELVCIDNYRKKIRKEMGATTGA